MPRANCGETTLHYELSGNPDAPCIIFSSALGIDLSMWNVQRPLFEQHFRVLRYDMRGHGSSSIPAGPYTIAQLGGDVLQLMDALHIEAASFCGLSIGGLIGQWLGAHAPERLQKLILCNTAAKIGTDDAWNQRVELVRQKGMSSIVEGVMARWFTKPFHDKHPEEVEAIASVLRSVNPDGYASTCAAVRDTDHRELIRKIQLPTMIIAGNADPGATVADAETMQSAIAGSRLTILPASHLSNIEAQAEFNQSVLSFLRA